MSTSAGWHPDPESPGVLRYWDGQTWTDHRAPTPPRGGGISVWKIITGVGIGVLAAFAALYIVFFMVNSSNEMDCAFETENAELRGDPPPVC